MLQAMTPQNALRCVARYVPIESPVGCVTRYAPVEPTPDQEPWVTSYPPHGDADGLF